MRAGGRGICVLVQLPRRGKTGWGAVAVSGMGLAHRDLDRGLGLAGQRDMLTLE